jgi:uncharacterized protein YigE (DUF2233 family)
MKKIFFSLIFFFIVSPIAYTSTTSDLSRSNSTLDKSNGELISGKNQDNDLVWQDIYPGVKYLFYETSIGKAPVKFYAVSIDLSSPGIRIIVSPPEFKFFRTSKFAQTIGAQIAINGGFCNYLTNESLGLAVYQGKKWKGAEDNRRFGFFAVTKGGTPWISPPKEVFTFLPKKAYMAISGFPMVVNEGKLVDPGFHGWVGFKQPRSAVGIDKSGKKLFLVVSDGRQKDSASISLETLAKFMVKIGVWEGLNIDGGASSTLYVEKKGGVVNHPSTGEERGVFNSLAVVINRAM